MQSIIGGVKPGGEQKHILYVTPFDEPFSGADESLLLAISKLDRERFHPHILIPCEAPYRSRYEALGVTVHEWPMSRMRRRYSPVFWMQFLRRLRHEWCHLPSLMDREKIEIVHINMHVALGPLLAARKKGVPCVVSYRAKTNDRPKVFFDVFLPWLHRHSDAMLCISSAVAEHFFKRGLRRGVRVLPNPVDIEQLRNQLDFNPYKTLQTKNILLFVGRLDPQKRVEVFLKALNILKKNGCDVYGVVVGTSANAPKDQAYEVELKRLAEKREIPVLWASGQKEVAPYMRHAKVLVLPSVNEGFGRVLIEAMALGLPVVGADSGAIPEVLQHGTYGRLFLPDQEARLAEEILSSLEDPEREEKLKEAQEHALKNFSAEEYSVKLVEVYEQLLAKSI